MSPTLAPPLLAGQLPSLACPESKGYELTKTGIVFHRALSDEEHDALGRRIAVVANASPWQFGGDWLVSATNHYDGLEAGVRRVLELTGRSLETARAWLKVALAYGHDERDLAPWTFYREALRLPASERVRTLTVARQNHWTRLDLVAFINKRLGIEDDAEAEQLLTGGASTHPGMGVARHGRRPPGPRHVCCPQCGLTFPVRGRGAKALEKTTA